MPHGKSDRIIHVRGDMKNLIHVTNSFNPEKIISFHELTNEFAFPTRIYGLAYYMIFDNLLYAAYNKLSNILLRIK